MRSHLFLTALVAFTIFTARAQDLAFAKKVVNDLCDFDMAGRGYVREGDHKAAEYIRKLYQASGLRYFGKDYYQTFGFPVVAFPYAVEVTIDDRELVPGDEFVVSPGCPVTDGTYEIIFVDSSTIDNPSELAAFEKRSVRNAMLVVDGVKGKEMKNAAAAKKLLSNGYKARGLIYANQDKFTWGVATEWEPFPVVYLAKGSIKRHHQSIRLLVQSEVRSHLTQNIAGYIPGTRYPDSFIVITAHYDHLGMMGKWAYFPGANDNASGVAMMLDLMQYYAQHKAEYSIAFIAFAGEEAGLFGSYYYTQNPLFPLKQISMLLNLDLMGTGDKGMTVVNATLFPAEFQSLELLNITKNHLVDVKPRGKAMNSDHYWFSENGVKAFFFYLMGEYHFYHDVNDTAEALTFSQYNEAFKLIRDFCAEYMAGSP
jgi:hypothetical protein